MADSFGYTEATLAERKVANSLGLGGGGVVHYKTNFDGRTLLGFCWQACCLMDK